MKFDMHCHTTRSDGTSTPEEVIQTAQDRELEMLFITDHDRASTDIVSMIQEAWIQTVPSVEISTRNTLQDNRSIHATYYTNNISSEIDRIIAHTRQQKQNLILTQLQHLESKWFIVDVDEFYAFNTHWGRSIDGLNKYDISNYITSKSENFTLLYDIIWPNIDMRSFHHKCMKRTSPLYKEYWVEVAEYEPEISDVADMTKDQWVLSIAHPNFTFSREKMQWFRKLYEEVYRPFGISALEINGKASRKWVETILDMKTEYGDDLQLTFGSDCHNIGKPDDKHEDLGVQNPYVEPEIITREMNLFKERLSIV